MSQYMFPIANICVKVIQSNSEKYKKCFIDENEYNDDNGEHNDNNNDDNNNNIENEHKNDSLTVPQIEVIDNAMATLCKMLKYMNFNNLNNNNSDMQNIEKFKDSILTLWYNHLPLKADQPEAVGCHEYLMELISQKNAIILNKNNNNIIYLLNLLITILNTRLSNDRLNTNISSFIQTIVKQSNINIKQILNPVQLKKLNLS